MFASQQTSVRSRMCLCFVQLWKKSNTANGKTCTLFNSKLYILVYSMKRYHKRISKPDTAYGSYVEFVFTEVDEVH